MLKQPSTAIPTTKYRGIVRLSVIGVFALKMFVDYRDDARVKYQGVPDTYGL